MDIADRESVNLNPLVRSTSRINNHYSNIFSSGFAIACLNINSLLAHIDKLRIFMDNSNLHNLSINESKLDSCIGNSEIHVEGYYVVRLHREVNGRNGGGSVCGYQ